MGELKKLMNEMESLIKSGDLALDTFESKGLNHSRLILSKEKGVIGIPQYLSVIEGWQDSRTSTLYRLLGSSLNIPTIRECPGVSSKVIGFLMDCLTLSVRELYGLDKDRLKSDIKETFCKEVKSANDKENEVKQASKWVDTPSP